MPSKKSKKVTSTLASTLAKKAVKQIETWHKFAKPRMQEIQQNEDLYWGVPLPRARGRFSVPLPMMGGFVDTLLSKTDEAPTLTYSSDDKADSKAVEFASRVARKIKRDRRLRWEGKNRNQKKLAAFAGFGVGEWFTESDPIYANHYSIIDHFDLVAEPQGGADLQAHKFCGRGSLFRSEWELTEGASTGFYDQKQVEKLIAAYDDSQKKSNFNSVSFKTDRFKRLGLDSEGSEYVGEDVYNLNWHGLTHRGRRYLLTLDYKSGIWVRCVPVEEVTGDPQMWPWEAWHTHEDEFNFLSKAVCDDLRPVCVGVDIIFNQALDNRQKRNFNMRAYDPNVFPNPEELEWRPDGLVEARTFTEAGIKQISQGIYEFKTEEISGSIDMITFMDSFVARKTGITDSAQGDTEEKRVGIYFGELQQVADRLGLYNKNYSDYYEAIGIHLLIGMREHLEYEDALDMLGISAAEPTENLIGDIKVEWDVEVTGGQAEFRANQQRQQNRTIALDKILARPSLAARLNPDKVIREQLLAGEWDEDDVEKFLDVADSMNADAIAEAEIAIKKILEGGKPPLNRGATLAFIKHINNFAINTTFSTDPQKDIEIFSKIEAFANAHLKIVAQNMAMKARDIRMQRLLANPEAVAASEGETPIEEPVPANTPEATAAASADFTEAITPEV